MIGAASENAPLRQSVLAGVSDSSRLQRIREVSQRMATPHFGRLILLFSPFWIRENTVEVDLGQLRVVQARGKFNRPANAAEQATISRWFAAVVEENHT
ncbi:hypothetical protein [Pelagicoccus sp. SDUM812002]|uniref:hypothetical protein n=1 Tax=Pelagicoccus sp. SDUM812002 TaxID=3041266 RepID=UPI0028125B81|nr:hypothetical protein [Pelagicoccus sp. SDUM812002]